jgi:hypothetical protein
LCTSFYRDKKVVRCLCAFGLQGLDITALDASADGASTGYTLVSDDATGKVERVLQLL